MFSRIQKIKEKGYSPDLVLDIGAYKGFWTRECNRIFNTQFMLFEAIDYAELKMSGKQVYNVLLNDKEEEVDWYEARNTGDSMFCEKTKHFVNCVPVKKQTTTLDLIFKDMTIPNEIFIKIDCQGAEIPILKGGMSLLKNVSFILLEMPFFGQYNTSVPSFLEHLNFMDSIGYVQYDICELHYINDFLMQIDIIFIKKDHPLSSVVQKLLF
jgi:FkbM family methyltransferase